MTNNHGYDKWAPLYRSSRNIPQDLRTDEQLRTLGLSGAGRAAGGLLTDGANTLKLYSLRSAAAEMLDSL